FVGVAGVARGSLFAEAVFGAAFAAGVVPVAAVFGAAFAAAFGAPAEAGAFLGAATAACRWGVAGAGTVPVDATWSVGCVFISSVPSGAGTRMSTPGAAMATWRPRLAPENSLSSMSVAVTAITFGSAAGNSGGDFGPALPAAAIRTMPLSCATLNARSSVGSRGPAKLMLTMRTSVLMA